MESEQGIYVRGGSIIVTQINQGKRLSINQAIKEEPLKIEIYLDENGEAEGQLYMDDGQSMAYLKEKERVLASFKFKENALFLNIDFIDSIDTFIKGIKI